MGKFLDMQQLHFFMYRCGTTVFMPQVQKVFLEAESQILARIEAQKTEECNAYSGDHYAAKNEICNAEPDDFETAGSHELEMAIRESEAAAVAQENAEVQEALLRSKIDSAKRQ